MAVPILEVVFKGVAKEPGVENLIREQVDRLVEVAPHLMSCRVAVEHPGEHLTSGTGYRVRIDMRLPPGKELVVKREEGEGHVYQDLEVVLKDAFHAAWRQLRDLRRKQRGEVKRHPEQEPGAVITQLAEDHGFVRMIDDDRQLYFHENSVVSDAFEDLEVGQAVVVTESMGDDGPQVSSLRVVDHRGGNREEETEQDLTPA